MCIVRSIGGSLILIASAATSISGALAADEPLPLEVTLDLEDIVNVEDLGPDRAVLETELTEKLEDWINERLFRFWTIGGPGAAHRLILAIDINPLRTTPFFTLKLEGNEIRFIDARGREPAKTPSSGSTFVNALAEEVEDFLRANSRDLETHSADVHEAANFGKFTKLALSRVMDASQQTLFLPNALTMRWHHKSVNDPVSRAQSAPFVTSVYVPPNTVRIADVRPKPFTGHLASDETVAQLCIHRPAIADGPFDPEVAFECPLSGQCQLTGATPTAWADDSCNHAAGPDHGGLWRYIISTAHAREGETWNVPSLNTLYDRLLAPETRFVGFTEFEIRAPELQTLEADAYTVALAANGVPLRIDGLPPEDDLRGLDTRDGLSLRFGLENLQFAGRNDGCERISAAFQFLKGGEPVGDRLVLERSYVALRNAPSVEYDTEFGKFDWTGRYIVPENNKEFGMFVMGGRYPKGDEDRRATTLARLNEARAKLDGFGWSISADELGAGVGLETISSDDRSLPIVGKIRPPRTEFADGTVAYGLEVGVEEPNGQLQFTFDWDQINALKHRLLALRAETPEAQAIVPEHENDLFVYQYTTERRESAPDWVCRE